MDLRSSTPQTAGFVWRRSTFAPEMDAPVGSGSDALEQFVSLAKTAKGAACVALIQQVLNHPKVFVFGELLLMPNVQAVSCSLWSLG
eukprot:scaffold470_cov257-Pinguiococcus_pyrenoidosus.AAC.18